MALRLDGLPVEQGPASANETEQVALKEEVRWASARARRLKGKMPVSFARSVEQAVVR